MSKTCKKRQWQAVKVSVKLRERGEKRGVHVCVDVGRVRCLLTSVFGMCSIGIQSEAAGVLYKISSQKRPLDLHYKIYNDIKKNQNIDNQ